MKSVRRTVILTILAFIVYLAIYIYILVVIWAPKTTSEVIKYSDINFEDNVRGMYIGELKGLLMPKNIDKLYSKLDSEYITKNGFTKDTFYNYATTKRLLNTNAVFYEYQVATQGDTYVYIFKYRSNGFERVVNLIETKPYEYTLSFDQDSVPSIGQVSAVKFNSDMKFEVTTLESKKDSIKYELKITNNGTKEADFDFLDINSILLVKSNGNTVSLAAVVASSDNEGLLPANSTITRELFYSVDLQEQGSLKGLIFKDVLIDGNKQDIEIDF
jgi:hypothetical protein